MPVWALTVFLNTAVSHQPLPSQGSQGQAEMGSLVSRGTVLLSHSPSSPGSSALRRTLVTLHPPSPIPWGDLLLAALHLPQDHKSGQSKITTIPSAERIKGEGLWEPQGFRGSQRAPSTQADHGPKEQNASLGTPAGALGCLRPRSPCGHWRLWTVTWAARVAGARGFPPS